MQLGSPIKPFEVFDVGDMIDRATEIALRDLDIAQKRAGMRDVMSAQIERIGSDAEFGNSE